MVETEKTINFSPYQSKLIRANQKYVCLLNEFGSGKTYGASWKANFLSRDIQKNNGAVIRNLHEDIRRNTAPLFAEYCFFSTIDTLPNDYVYNKSTKTFTYPNLSVINFIAMDRPDDVKKIKNDVFGWVWLEQAEELDEEIFQACVRRCRRHKNKNDNKIFLTANAEEGSWIYDYFFCDELNVKHEKIETEYGTVNTDYGLWRGKNDKFLGIKAPPGYNKENLPPDYYDSIIETSPKDVVMRYVYNIPIGKSGKIYSFSEDNVVYEEDYIDMSNLLPDFDKLIEGQDYGISETNPMVFLWGVRRLDGTIYITNEYYEYTKGIEHCSNYVKQTRPGFGIQPQFTVGCPRTFQREGTSGRRPKDLFSDQGLIIQEFPIHFDVRQPLIDKLFKTGQLKIFERCKNLIRELKSYKWKNIKTADNHAIEALERSVSKLIMSGTNKNIADYNKPATTKRTRQSVPLTANFMEMDF